MSARNELFRPALAHAGELARAGRLAEAEGLCRELLSRDERAVDAWGLLGTVQLDLGKNAEAATSLQRALLLDSTRTDFLLRLSVAQFRCKDAPAARSTLQRLLAANPRDVEGLFHLGYLYARDGDPVAAENHYRQVLAIQPEHRDTLAELGKLLRSLKRPQEALPFLDRALRISPGRADLANAAAWASLELGLYPNAVQYAQTAVNLAKEDVSSLLALGIAARHARLLDAALPALDRARTLAPADVVAQAEFGLASIDAGDFDSGRAALARAHALAPGWPTLRWFEALALPVIASSNMMAESASANFLRGVDQLIAALGAGDESLWRYALHGLERSVPFYLHYLPVDATIATCRFADLVALVTQRTFARFAAPVSWRALAHGGRLRVGFVSSAFRTHTVMRYFAGWILGLDRSQFELHAWHLNSKTDAVTQRIAAAVDTYNDAARSKIGDVAAAIHDARLDALIHLDVGMNPRAQMLASLRLAPVQCVAYGHPVTSGMSTVDFFLSGDALEPADAAQHYRERLVRLPGLGVVPERPPPAGDGTWLPRASKRPLLICLQNLIKLIPAFDDLLVEIVRRTGASVVLFAESQSLTLTEQYRARAMRAFAAAAVDFDAHVTIVARRDYETYLGAIAAADLVLDSPHFSGGATSLDALSVGTPVVTLEGTWMRGRQTAAMLRMMDVAELITHGFDEYATLVAQLTADPARRQTLREKLRRNRAALFDAADVIPALQDFLQRAVRSSAGDIRP